MNELIDPFRLEFMQRGAAEVALLAPLAGILGAQIVLRRLAFFTHGVGTAAFPGLVVAGPAGISPAIAALGVGVLFAGALEGLTRAARIAYDSATALLLVAALAVGIILASDVFESGNEVDQLLFGSLLAIGDRELITTAVALGVAALAAVASRRAWIASGFDDASSRALGLRPRLADWALLTSVAVAAIAALDATGALLVGAILVIPPATARPFARSVRSLELSAAAIALAEGLLGLWIAYELDVPPGAAIAALGGAIFAVCGVLQTIVRRRAALSAGS